MGVINRKSKLWEYLTEEIQGLISDGESLIIESQKDDWPVSDYSYLVFPFAKAYEGFLKRLFLDLDMIREDEYYGDEIRIGRILNPFYNDKKHSVYEKLGKHKKVGSTVFYDDVNEFQPDCCDCIYSLDERISLDSYSHFCP